MQNDINPLSKKIGIIGGGQLGRMFIQNASRLGVEVHILDRSAEDPAALLAQKHIQGALTDAAAIRKLAEHADVLTYEIEHINTEVLHELEAEGKKIIPSPSILSMIQDKGLQKQFYQQNNIPTAPFVVVNQPSEWEAAISSLNTEKVAAKACKGGYDGKGVLLTTLEWVKNNPSEIPFEGPTMIESFIPCKKELAVMVARGIDGATAVYPAVDMEFDPKSNLVTYLYSPADISAATEAKAATIALDIVKALDGPGIFAVEFFLDFNDQLWVNEIAPRPHNSAHHTIEGFYTSQYDQLLRVLLGLPLGSTAQKMPSVMVNLVGPRSGEGNYYIKNLDFLCQQEGVYLHLYGKKTSKPDRKLGHITITRPTLEEARYMANAIREKVSVGIVEG